MWHLMRQDPQGVSLGWEVIKSDVTHVLLLESIQRVLIALSRSSGFSAQLHHFSTCSLGLGRYLCFPIYKMGSLPPSKPGCEVPPLHAPVLRVPPRK